MTMKLFDLFFTSIRVAGNIDHARFATDPEYPQILIGELCGEQDGGQANSTESNGDATDKSNRLAA